jgi:hypothetical protein
VWASGGRLFGVVAGGGPPGPLPAPQLLYDAGDPLSEITDPHIDMGINGTAYVAFTAPGERGSDVRVVRLQGSAWEGVPVPLDISGGQPAGDGGGRARVAVSAEGNAVVVWGESHPDGRRRVYGRRVTGLAPSSAPQEVSLPEFDGAPGGAADSPDIDIEDDGSYAWVVWRQDFGDRSRSVARRLVGSLFETPVAVDGGGNSETPRISMNGRGVGIAAAAVRHSWAIFAPILQFDAFTQAFRVDTTGGAGAAVPAVGASEREDLTVAWRTVAPVGGTDAVRAVYRDRGQPFAPETIISQGDFGPAGTDGIEVAEDRGGNFAIAFLQGPAAGRRLVVAAYDRDPGLPVGLSTVNYQRRSRPRFKWRPGSELWGPQTFKVFVDDQEIGSTQRSFLVAPQPIEEGAHTWRVVAVDRRGQQVSGRQRTLRVDFTPPDVELKIDGRRKRGQTLKFDLFATDQFGSGIKYVQLDFGDGSPPTTLRRVRHRYRRSGLVFVKVKAVDRAGNVTRDSVRLRLRK